MDEIKKLIEDALSEDQNARVGDVESWSPINGEPATYGVELRDGRTFFVTIEPS